MGCCDFKNLSIASDPSLLTFLCIRIVFFSFFFSTFLGVGTAGTRLGWLGWLGRGWDGWDAAGMAGTQDFFVLNKSIRSLIVSRAVSLVERLV